MGIYSLTSRERLNTCHPQLRRIFLAIIGNYDHVIAYGHRGKAEQDMLFDKGLTKVRWPHGKHNKAPSEAVDAYPYDPKIKGIPWPQKGDSEAVYRKKLARFYHFAGYVQATADQIGIPIRCGCDWDTDRDFLDQAFDDIGHFELINL